MTYFWFNPHILRNNKNPLGNEKNNLKRMYTPKFASLLSCMFISRAFRDKVVFTQANNTQSWL